MWKVYYIAVPLSARANRHTTHVRQYMPVFIYKPKHRWSVLHDSTLEHKYTDNH